MPSSRIIKTLGIITGVLALLVLAFSLRDRSHPQFPFARVIDPAQKITLQTGAAEIELQRDGSSWTVGKNPDGPRYPADSTKVQSLLTQLKNLKLEDEISDRPDRAAEYEVDAGSGAHVTAYGANGSVLAGGIFGKQAQDFTHLYFKFPDKPSVYLARGAVRGEIGPADVNSWRSLTLFNFPEDRVEAIFIEGPGFKTPLIRSSDTWSANGKVLNSTPIWGMLGVLAHLKATEFANPSQHPEWTADTLRYASVTVQLHGGEIHELHVGAPDPQTKRFPVAVDKSPSVAWIDEASAKAFLRKTSDFKR